MCLDFSETGCREARVGTAALGCPTSEARLSSLLIAGAIYRSDSAIISSLTAFHAN